MSLHNLKIIDRVFKNGQDYLRLSFDFPDTADSVHIFQTHQLPDTLDQRVFLELNKKQALTRVKYVTKEEFQKYPIIELLVAEKQAFDLVFLPCQGNKPIEYLSENTLKNLPGQRERVLITLPNLKVVDRLFVRGKDTLALTWDFPEGVSEVKIFSKPSGSEEELQELDGGKYLKATDFKKGYYQLQVVDDEAFDLFFEANTDNGTIPCQNSLSNLPGRKPGLAQLQREGEPQYLDGRDQMKVSWLQPTEVTKIEIYSGQFAQVDWTDEVAIQEAVASAQLLDIIDKTAAEQFNYSTMLDVVEAEPYDLLFVPLVEGKERRIGQNLICNNPQRRRLVYWRVVEEGMPLSEFKFGKPLKRVRVEIFTDERALIAKEALEIKIRDQKNPVSLMSDFSSHQPLNANDYQYRYQTKDTVKLVVTDGYEGIILKRLD